MNKKIIHSTNIGIGIVSIGSICLLVSWLYVHFEIWKLSLFFTVLVVWFVSYLLQIKYPTKKVFLTCMLVELTIFAILFIQISNQFTVIIGF
ncbi:hypothetical protein KO561_12050 [Radiobacillus kanasensis]|uniref:hypothetical protein n=1 Tax=Radiobacillus kanasensis TaxID=2844358 RepID=UPI001E4C2F69|nr:hypothetical protein [Radiobacillus kanasensis]UFT97940.1 hypothetical protein KO561_12050 [Radiobacillus kanasensis]